MQRISIQRISIQRISIQRISGRGFRPSRVGIKTVVSPVAGGDRSRTRRREASPTGRIHQRHPDADDPRGKVPTSRRRRSCRVVAGGKLAIFHRRTAAATAEEPVRMRNDRRFFFAGRRPAIDRSVDLQIQQPGRRETRLSPATNAANAAVFPPAAGCVAERNGNGAGR